MEHVRDFFDYLVSSGTLEQTAHMTTTLKFDSGDKQIVSQSILSGVKNYIISAIILY